MSNHKKPSADTMDLFTLPNFDEDEDDDYEDYETTVRDRRKRKPVPLIEDDDNSSIGYRHSRLSSFGTSNFFKKNVCTCTGIFLFVFFAAPVPTCGSCCFIRVTSPSLY